MKCTKYLVYHFYWLSSCLGNNHFHPMLHAVVLVSQRKLMQVKQAFYFFGHCKWFVFCHEFSEDRFNGKHMDSLLLQIHFRRSFICFLEKAIYAEKLYFGSLNSCPVILVMYPEVKTVNTGLFQEQITHMSRAGSSQTWPFFAFHKLSKTQQLLSRLNIFIYNKKHLKE